MRKQLIVDLEHKSRESKFIEARNEELHNENSRLRALLESTLHTGGNGGDKVPLKQQVHTLRSELDQTRRELNDQLSASEEMAEQLKDAQAKAKVLEEALAFRAEEVGLSGQADLLSKLAALRSEVNALKVDLIEKRNRIHDIESDKVSTAERNSSLQQQLAEIQERYERSKHDIKLLQNRDELAKRLAEVENERDVLLEFIQEDVQKNAAITATLDNAVREAAEFRRAASLAQEEAKRLSGLNETQRSHIQGLESELGTARADLKQLEDVRKRLSKRDLELQEYTKMHLTYVGDVSLYNFSWDNLVIL
jgi:chromosome segregation ATPase